MAKAIVFLVLLFISPAAYAATTHTVGGSAGWNTNVNYVTWANGQTFVTGDTLLFNYDPSHTVDEVSLADYTSCNIGNPISSGATSPTSISLTASGIRYFICPQSNHCSRGMKLAVTITAGSTSPGAPTPPTGGTTPSPPSGTPETPATPGTPPSKSAPPPPNGGAASTLGGRNSLMAGLSLVLAAMLGLMG